MDTYDSKADTLEHIQNVNGKLIRMAHVLLDRARVHDASKLVEPEKSGFDNAQAKLRNLKYGSAEYAASLEELKPVLEHHYAHNSHHPEYFGEQGVNGMTLFDVLEMLADWKAAGERTKDGSLKNSIEVGIKRFNIECQTAHILIETAYYMSWITALDRHDLFYILPDAER